MIQVTFDKQFYNITQGRDAPDPRIIDADNVCLHEGWATFEKYVPVEGEKWKDSLFVEAIRLEAIESMVRVDP